MNVDIYMNGNLVLSYNDYVVVLPLALNGPSAYLIG